MVAAHSPDSPEARLPLGEAEADGEAGGRPGAAWPAGAAGLPHAVTVTAARMPSTEAGAVAPARRDVGRLPP
jgi:hypothetical protein